MQESKLLYAGLFYVCLLILYVCMDKTWDLLVEKQLEKKSNNPAFQVVGSNLIACWLKNVPLFDT